MPALLFPNLDALRLAVASGIVPADAAAGPARARTDDHGRLWLEPAAALPRDAVAALARIGVPALGDGGPLPRSLRGWAEALPPRPTREPATGPVLFDLPAPHLAAFLARARRFGPRPVGVRLLDPDSPTGRAWVTLPDPPQSLLLACDDPDSPVEGFAEQAAGVWVRVGWRHPLADRVPVPAGHVVLVRPERDWQFAPGPVPTPTPDEFHLPPAATRAAAADPVRPVGVRFALAPGDTPHESLWVVDADAFADLLAAADERLLARYEAAAVDGPGGRRVLLRATAGRRPPPFLPLSAGVYYRHADCAGLYLPAGRVLRPAARPAAVARAFGVVPGRIVWVEPAGNDPLPRSAPAAFRPLREWVEYDVPPPATLSPARTADPFAFARLVLADEPPLTLVPLEPPSPTSVRPPTPAGADAPRLGWLTRSLDRLTSRLRRAARPPAPRNHSTPAAKPAADDSAPGRVEQKLASSDALLHGHDWPARRHDLEARLLRDLPALGPDDRATRWAELAAVYSAVGVASEAALCWMNAAWEADVPPADWLEQWLQAEARAAKLADPVAALDRWLADPSRAAGAGRVVAAFAAAAGGQSPPHPALVERLPKLLAFLDHHFDDLPARAAWLARASLTRLCDGDALGLARWRDRLVTRLRDRGPGLDLDEPAFLRFHGTASADRFQAARDWLAKARDPVRAWVGRLNTGGQLQWVGLDAETECTAAYADLMLAWGLGCLGERTRARDWTARARRALAAAAGPRTDPEVHRWLGDLFAHRVRDAQDGRPPAPGLPPDLAARLGALPDYSRYAVDKLREVSRILEPAERVNPFRGRDVREFRGSDLLGERLHLLADSADRAAAVGEARHLLAACAADPGPATVPRVVFTLLDAAARLDGPTVAAVLTLTPTALDGLDAALTGGRWAPAERADRVTRYAARMIDAAFRAAVAADAGPAARPLLAYVARRAAASADLRAAVGAVGGGLFRALRKLGLRSEAEDLLRALDGGGPAVTPARVGLAAGWFLVGMDDEATRILDAARERLFLTGEPDDRARAALAAAYADALGVAPPRMALGRLGEIFQRLPPSAGWSNQYFTPTPLALVDTVVRAVVSDEFALGPAVRGWLDDDEFLIRRRIHRDLSAAVRADGLG